VGSLSDHCRSIGVDYQSGTELPHSKGCRHFNRMTAFNVNLHASVYLAASRSQAGVRTHSPLLMRVAIAPTNSPGSIGFGR